MTGQQHRAWPVLAGRRRRVLISAAAFSPARGSEPGIGWNICTRLAGYHDVVVLCCPFFGSENHRQEVESYLRTHGDIPGLTIHFVEPAGVAMADGPRF